MTENTMPVGATALAEPPAPVLPPGDDDTADAGNRRNLMIVGAALGALVLLIAAFFMLKGGGSTPVSSGAPVLPHPAAAAPTTPHHQAKASKPLKLPKAYKGHVGKDPFKPLYVAPVAQASQAPSDGGGDGTTGNTLGAPPTEPVTQPTTPTATTSLGHPVWVELVRVNGAHDATFVVGYSNGRKLTTRTFRGIVAPKGSTGTVFAKQFTLLSVQNGEATIQFGDGTPLDIAPGAANKVVVN
jgi:hypothetical protein